MKNSRYGPFHREKPFSSVLGVLKRHPKKLQKLMFFFVIYIYIFSLISLLYFSSQSLSPLDTLWFCIFKNSLVHKLQGGQELRFVQSCTPRAYFSAQHIVNVHYMFAEWINGHYLFGVSNPMLPFTQRFPQELTQSPHILILLSFQL